MMASGEAIELLRSDDLTGIGMAAHGMRQRLHPEGIVSYASEAMQDGNAAWATIMFPAGETAQGRVARLEQLRAEQEGSRALLAVTPQLAGTAAEYLKVLAVTRLYLENISHIQTSWSVGMKICQIALHFGADDIVGLENERRQPTEEQLRRLIRDAGFIPKQRDRLFRSYGIG